MPIKVTDDPDVEVTCEELARWTDEYQRRFMMFAGTPPTLAEFIRRERNRKPLGISQAHNG